MSHDHPHDHPHPHPHGSDEPLPAHLDLRVPDAELPPSGVGRRHFLESAGLLGTAAATGALTGASPAAATAPARRRVPRGGYRWLAGDHHIHTQYSSDAIYRVVDQVQHAAAYGLDWMVITDHGSVAHAKIGVEKVNPDIRAARGEFEGRTLVFQGLEWNIPAAEHGTVFVHPGRNEVAVLKEFENAFDGSVNGVERQQPGERGCTPSEGLDFLAQAVTTRRVDDAMFFANHPARNGVDSPHEIRGWRERQPRHRAGHGGRARPPGRRPAQAARARLRARVLRQRPVAPTASPATRWRAT